MEIKMRRRMKKAALALGLALCLAFAGCGAEEAGSTTEKSVKSISDAVDDIDTSDSESQTEASETETENGETEEATSEQEKQTGEASALVEETLAGMSLYDKICQMMFVTPESITGMEIVTAAGETTKASLEKYPVGGIMYSAQNLESSQQVTEMIANSQEYSDIDLFIAADEEGGIVNRLMRTLGTTYIDSMYNYRNDGTETAYNNAYTIASDMSSYGFNLDFAPVADVWSNPDNTVIGERAYSDDFSQAAELVGSAVKGFEAGGVLCTLKHFPGHGDTAQDSHYSSAYVTKTKDEIMSEEMLPFEAGIEAGADFVMVGHLIVPDIDELPATLSYKIGTEMLRDEIGFEGVVITDSLNMEAISDNYTAGDAAVMAVQAGMDMLLDSADIDAAIAALENAVESGEITEDRIDQSVRRILTAKEKAGLLK